jgi:VIT1/CCC1 family predicted Fe2+/Mn2+ transporter
LIPLIPWLFTDGGGATLVSVVLGAVAAVGVGVLLANVTDRPRWRSGLRQLLIAMVAAGVTYAVGSAVGVSV